MATIHPKIHPFASPNPPSGAARHLLPEGEEKGQLTIGDSQDATWTRAHTIFRMLAWVVATVALLNVLYFVLRATCPVFRGDDWYFLNVFLRKAIDGTLGFADFFVRRAGADHAQPLFKLVLLGEWRYLDADLTLGAVLGVFAAASCALIYLRLLVTPKTGKPASAVTYLAWAAICTLLFSLNGGTASQWTWPLAALDNITILIILLFLLAVWHALQTRRYTLLLVATLFLGISSDDSALIGVIAALFTLFLMQFADPAHRNGTLWKIVLTIVICMVAVRIGYRFVPIVGKGLPSTHTLETLMHRFADKGWWMWVVYPLTLSVSYGSPFRSVDSTAWLTIIVVMAVILIATHIWFWGKALRSSYSRKIFVAVATMLVTYGWVAGIVLHRASYFGNSYIAEPRYTMLYSGQLIALMLMWIGTRRNALQPFSDWRHTVGRSAPIIGCLILLLVQIPLSANAWRARPALQAYSAMMARQIGALARNPTHTLHCVPEEPICNWPENKRVQMTRLLSQNRLNVFSPKVQAMHSYLPRLQPIPSGFSSAEPGLLERVNSPVRLAARNSRRGDTNRGTRPLSAATTGLSTVCQLTYVQ